MDGLRHASMKLQQPTPLPTSAQAWGAPVTRPLSDIREATESSLIDLAERRSWQQQRWNNAHPQRKPSRASSMKRGDSLKHNGSARIVEPRSKSSASRHQRGGAIVDGSSSYSTTPDSSCTYNIPQSSIPHRSSSKGHGRKTLHHLPSSGIRQAAEIKAVTALNRGSPWDYGLPSVPVANTNADQSSVKEAHGPGNPVMSAALGEAPSRTVARTKNPSDIIDFPNLRHSRVKLGLHVSQPVCVGGGSVSGNVKVVFEDIERARVRRVLAAEAIAVDLLGFEAVGENRRAPFLFLGTDLIDGNSITSDSMVEPKSAARSSSSTSVTTLPFMINLPLDTGPPPFQSKYASIRFILAATLRLRDSAKHYRVRTSSDIYVLSTYDPERALTSLPSPLIASDELEVSRKGTIENLKLNAGLHRQVWVSGSSVFVDVHIVNRSSRPVKRLELMLERDILCYKHAAAKTLEKSAGQTRIFESNFQTILARNTFKQGISGWTGVDAHSNEAKTFELAVPKGHATVKCGKYFEVRFFLNVTANLSTSKAVSVQLPVILIHINSLDVLPNSVAQVAAAIDEKRAQQKHQRSRSRTHTRTRSQGSVSSPARARANRREPMYTQGRAFAAPRQQSLDRARRQRQYLTDLADIIDSSPRKHQPHLQGLTVRKLGTETSIGRLNLGGSQGAAMASSSSSNIMAEMAYHTPPSNRKGRHFGEVGDERFGSLRARLRRMRSFSSGHSTQSAWTNRSRSMSRARWPGLGLSSRQSHRRPGTALGHRDIQSSSSPSTSTEYQNKENQRLKDGRPTVLLPHVLGLSSSNKDTSVVPGATDGSIEVPRRPETGLSFRSRLDRTTRTDVQPRRKLSGTALRAKGIRLWERAKSRERTRQVEPAGAYSTAWYNMGRDLAKERDGWI